MSDERKFIHLYATHVEFKYLSHINRAQVTCTLIGDLDGTSQADWDPYQKKINEGWKVYETEGLVHEALLAIQTDLKKEKQRYADLERSKADVISEFGQKLSLQQAELERLRKMERDLEALSGLGTHKMVR